MKALVSIICMVLIFLSGCQGEKETADYLSCKTNADCKITSYPINNCCAECEVYPINIQGFESQAEWRMNNCDFENSPCPIWDCYIPRPNVSCVDKECRIINEANE